MWYCAQVRQLSDKINFQQMACHFILMYMKSDVWISFITCQQADSWVVWSQWVCNTYIRAWVCTAGDMNRQAWTHLLVNWTDCDRSHIPLSRIYLHSTYALAAAYTCSRIYTPSNPQAAKWQCCDNSTCSAHEANCKDAQIPRFPFSSVPPLSFSLVLMNGRVMNKLHESNQSLNEGEAGTHLGSYTDPGWPGAGEGSCRLMWHARFAAAEPPGGPGSHSPQRRRGAPVGRLARNRNRNRGSLGDTVQGRRRKGGGWGVGLHHWGK